VFPHETTVRLSEQNTHPCASAKNNNFRKCDALQFIAEIIIFRHPDIFDKNTFVAVLYNLKKNPE
jgi:hypothetical protein